jgi:hypothetical protein
MRHATVAIVPPVSAKKLDKDILKHASRIRTSQSKDYSTKSLPIDSVPFTTDNTKRNSINKPLKSMSLVSYNEISQIFLNIFCRFLMNMTSMNGETQVIK